MRFVRAEFRIVELEKAVKPCGYGRGVELVFNSKNMSVKILFKEGGAFFGGRLFSYLFELVWMNLTVMVLRIDYMIAKVIGQIVIVIMNYFISKIFVFKDKKDKPEV